MATTASVRRGPGFALTPKLDTLYPTLSISELTEEASLSVLSGAGVGLHSGWPDLSRKFILEASVWG